MSCLQVWVDTFTGQIETFPCPSEQAKEVIKILIHETIPRFGLPWSLQSDNGSAFKAAVTQGVSKALGIEYHLHCSWRPQSPNGKAFAYKAGDLGSIPGLGRSSEEGNGNPLQYSCMESPMDGVAWLGMVYGVAKSRT